LKHYLGIDFGTSNTHVARCFDQNADTLVAEPVPINDSHSTPTCLLWREPAKDETDVVAYGSKAEEEWANLSEEQQNKYRLVLGFKPNIAGDGSANREAYANARAFLGKICRYVLDHNPELIERGTVVVGVPAEIGKDHIDATARAAQEAGFMSVECVGEPLGALAYHLNDGSLSLEDARRGVAVIDFGGGTFDVALVDAERGLQKPWGDPTLGGLLFDDLFYQWINENNHGSLYDGLSENKKKVIWMAECRRVEESFSRSWANSGTVNNFRGYIFVRDKRNG
jgi:molecular chaperone DnaK